MRRKNDDKDNLVLAREEVWVNADRACAFALIDIAQSLRDHRTKVLTDENVPIPGGLPHVS